MQREIIEKCKASGKVKVDTSLVYCHYSLNCTTLVTSGYLDFLKQEKIGLIGASPIAMGLLTNRGPPAWHPANHKPAITEACNKAIEYCQSQEIDISRIAMFFTLANPDIPTTLVTSANPGRMAGNVKACYEAPTEKELAVTKHVMDTFFPWHGEYDKATWVGIEPGIYWQKMGKKLETARRYPNHVSKNDTKLSTN